MARLDTDDPFAAKKQRGFPFRLVLYALLMTGAAGAAGWYAWTLHAKTIKQATELETCAPALTKAQGDLNKAATDLTAKDTALTQATDHSKQTDAQLARLGKDLNASQEELAALRAQRAESEKRMKAIADIQAQFAKMIDTGQLKVSGRHGGLVVELPSEVLFPSASADLSKPGEMAVLEVGFILKKFPDRRFLVVGHTDNVPLKGSTFQDNWQLSTARALTVTRFLMQAGMKPESVMAAGAGEHDPIAKNDSAKDRQRNRRIEIQLLPQLSELPPLPPSLEASTGTDAPKTP